MISLNNLEDLKYRFCKELKLMLKNDKQVEQNYIIKKKQEEAEEIELTSKSKKHQILSVISRIKTIMADFSVVEINRVIEIILKYPDIMEQMIIKRVVFTKELIFEILHFSSVEDSVRKIRGFVNEKVFKIDYEVDPMHRNTTTVCKPKGSNRTKEDNKTDDKPGEDDDTKKVKFNIIFFF